MATATTPRRDGAVQPIAQGPVRTALADGLALAGRNVRHIRRNPEDLLDVTIQPIMFTVLFVYVFGGAIQVPGVGYKDFLMGGIMVQTLAFTAFGTGQGIARDRAQGFVERLRALPAARASLIIGRALSDLARTSLAITILSLTALVIGWRPDAGVGGIVGAYALMLLFAFAMVWLGVVIGCVASSPEAVMGVGFVAIFPLTFIANTFVPTASMPDVVRFLAEWNPLSSITLAVRELMGNAGPAVPDAAWPLQHAVPSAFAWCGILLVLLVPIALARFRQVIAE